MTLDAAKARLQVWVDQQNANRITYWDGQQEPECAICPDPEEKPYGWVFSIQSKAYLEGDPDSVLVGGGRIVVRTDVREIHFLPPAHFYNFDFTNYEKGRVTEVHVIDL